MSWTRLDDAWTDMPELAVLDLAARWHYLAMIQFCSRTERIDGVMKRADARRCSDVDDPEAALAVLRSTGLLLELPGNDVKVVRIDDHIPPPSVRQASKAAKLRKRRERAHKAGDHSTCLPENCDQAPVSRPDEAVTAEVTGEVTRDIGSGRDGTGRDVTGIDVSDVTEAVSVQWEPARVPGSGLPGQVLADAEGACPECGADECTGECLDAIR
ncbi:hypothetical protein [Pseudactinotalea sp.]|uniref:hypothetical protein n=1 Tax=Pseudactinotalea sp. TaxID=1926260 RepID=UPI003B3B5913